MKKLIYISCLLAASTSLAKDFYYSDDNYIYRSNGVENVSITPHISTLGYGGDIVIGMGKSFALRGQYNYFKRTFSSSAGGAILNADVLMNTVGGMVDYIPFDGFRISLGAFKNNNTLKSTISGGSIINGTTYTAAQLGTTSVDASFKNTVSPYAGVGYNSSFDGGFGIDLSAGVLYQGNSAVSIKSTGTIVQADLNKVQQDVANRLNKLRIYPVVSIGFSYKF